MDKEKVFIVSDNCGENCHIFHSEKTVKDWIRKNVVENLFDIYGILTNKFSTDEILCMIQKDLRHLEEWGHIEELWYITEGVIED